jgi:arylsulfatase A-like enzyme
MLKRFFFILVAIVLLSGCFVSTYHTGWDIVWDSSEIEKKEHFLATLKERNQAGRPNVIIIMADDLGKYEVSAYGAEDIQTPNIDAIGTDGVRFQDAYVTAPICAPSRAAILTGRYQQRYGFETQPMDFYPTNKLEFGLGKKSDLGDWRVTADPDFPSPWMVERQGVPPNEINIAELFQASGYSTGIVGKWHLGFGEEHLPNHRGFDYQYGFYGAFSLYTPTRKTGGFVNFIQDDLSSRHQWGMGRNENAAIRENNKVVQEDNYLTFALKDKAKSFVSKNKDDNFFLYLSFNAPHVPFQAPQSYYDQFSHIKDENRRVYLAMIKALDDAIGDFMEHLKKEGLDENTIVYFISDNGGASYTGATHNGPLKGGKITHFEGGVNVPFMMRWKGHIPAGSVFNMPVSSMDIFTTSLVASGISLPKQVKIDGQDLMPYIQGTVSGQPHEKLYWRTDHIHAIRYQKWKLLLSTRDQWMHLYNLESDKSEKVDLKDLNDAEKQMLLRFFQEWNEELPKEYLWPRIMDRKFVLGDKTYYFPA